MPDRVPAPVRGTRALSAFALGAFLLLGVLYAVLGPALPNFSERFGLKATGASLLLSVNAGGAFLGVLVAGFTSARLSARRRSAIGVGLLAAGCVGLATADSFALALAASGLLGLGFGLLDLTVNVWVSTGFGEQSASAINRLSATFGVGAVVAPLAVGAFGGDFRPLLVASGVLAALLLAVLAAMPREPAAVEGAADAAAPAGASHGTLAVFILLFVGYVAVESGVSGWEVTHLQALGASADAAARWTSLFWVCFAAGRVLAGTLAMRMPPDRLVCGSLLLSVGALALATVPGAAPVAYALAGLCLAPVFPTALVWLTRVWPGGAPPTLVFAGGFLGPMLFSPLVGVLLDSVGPVAIPASLLGVAVVDAGLALALAKVASRGR